jgi:hypothetical protein
MHLFATLVGCVLALAASVFLFAGVVAMRLRARRARLTTAIADLLLIVEATVWHVGIQEGKLGDDSALKTEALVLVREMGAFQIFELTVGLRLSAAMVEPMLSGLIEKAVASAKAAPTAAPAAASDQPAEQ